MYSLTGKSDRSAEAGASTWSLLLYVVLLFLASVALWPLGAARSSPSDTSAAATADLTALERAFQEVAQRVAPSVVGIRARRHYFAAVPGETGADPGSVEQLVILNGSGTIVRPDGTILTNEHVIQSAAEITVILHDGRTFTATVAAADPRSDLAIIRIDAEGLTPVRFCDWSAVARGQWSLALGNPYGLGSDGHLSVSVGVISNLGRGLPGLGEVDDRLYADMIQTTAPIHPGNSGGPLFNIHGELLGVVTAVHTRTADGDGVGFAIPMTPAKRRVIDGLLEGRPIAYGYLGLTVRALEPAERTAAGLQLELGVLVEQVEPDGPAAQAGVLVGDILTRYDAQPVDSPMRLADLVGQTPVGRDVGVELWRAGAALSVRATVGMRQPTKVAWLRSGAVLWRGMRLTSSSPAPRADAGSAGVLVIDVRAGTPAERAGVRSGDVVDSVEGAAVQEPTAFLQAVRGRHGAVRLGLRHRGTVAVPP
jgi:serine protease Do